MWDFFGSIENAGISLVFKILNIFWIKINWRNNLGEYSIKNWIYFTNLPLSLMKIRRGRGKEIRDNFPFMCYLNKVENRCKKKLKIWNKINWIVRQFAYEAPPPTPTPTPKSSVSQPLSSQPRSRQFRNRWARGCHF